MVKAVEQPKESIPTQAKLVPKLSVDEKIAPSAPKTMPVLAEAIKKVEKSPVTQEASQLVVISAQAAKVAAATPSPLASKSTMRLATVTPNRQKKPPTTAPNSKKAPAAVAGTSAVKTPAKAKPAEAVKSPAVSPKKAATVSAPSTVSTPVAQSSSAASLKTKRSRVKVQHFQSPTPEIALVTKLSTQTANPNKNGSNDDKLTIFYK